MIPVIDVRNRFKLQPRAYDDRTCVVVVNINNTSIGLIVDTVNEVLNIPGTQVSPPPRYIWKKQGGISRGWARSATPSRSYLDVNKLLYDQEVGQVTKV